MCSDKIPYCGEQGRKRVTMWKAVVHIRIFRLLSWCCRLDTYITAPGLDEPYCADRGEDRQVRARTEAGGDDDLQRRSEFLLRQGGRRQPPFLQICETLCRAASRLDDRGQESGRASSTLAGTAVLDLLPPIPWKSVDSRKQIVGHRPSAIPKIMRIVLSEI